MDAKNLASAVSNIYAVLDPLSEADRLNVVRAALMLFGQSFSPEQQGASAAPTDRRSPDGDSSVGYPTKAGRWIQQSGLTEEMLSSVFYLDDSTPQVIAEVPGSTAQEKTINCYLLTGAAAFLKTGEPDFEDASARALCEHEGCYDATNHSKRINQLGNRAVGSKAKGWKMLAPGLKEAASLVRRMAEGVAN